MTQQRARVRPDDGAPTKEILRSLARDSFVRVDELCAGYGKMEILHSMDLHVGRGQSLCLIGPNGAGKSTVLHSLFGFARVTGGTVLVDGADITRLTANDKLRRVGIAYILQDSSVFPDMTVEENLLMGGFLMKDRSGLRARIEAIFSRYDRLAERRSNPARVLSGGERRLLEIARALIMEPAILLIDEPSIGLEPRFINMVFEILADLQNEQNKTIIMVEQNAKKGLEFSDIGYVLVSGKVAMAGTGEALLRDPEIGKLFLGG